MTQINPLAFLSTLHARDFDRYEAPNPGKKLNQAELKKLSALIGQLPEDRNLLLYYWRFVFKMDLQAIRRFSGVEYANGVIEAFRFTCKRYLDIIPAVSNPSMSKAFEAHIGNYDLVLVARDKGLCWFRDLAVPGQLVREAIKERKDLSGRY